MASAFLADVCGQSIVTSTQPGLERLSRNVKRERQNHHHSWINDLSNAREHMGALAESAHAGAWRRACWILWHSGYVDVHAGVLVA